MKRFFLIVFIALVIVLFFLYVFFSDYLTIDLLKHYRLSLKAYADAHPLLSPLIFITAYWVVGSLAIPINMYLSILSGFLFPNPYCVFYAIIGATIGAATIFLLARGAFAELLMKKGGVYLDEMEGGIRKNAAGYLLFSRQIIFIPFWFLNIAPAYFGVPFRTFVWTTFIGVIPETIVLTQAGAGLGAILDHSDEVSLITILRPEWIVAFVVVALLGIVLLTYKKSHGGED